MYFDLKFYGNFKKKMFLFVQITINKKKTNNVIVFLKIKYEYAKARGKIAFINNKILFEGFM